MWTSMWERTAEMAKRHDESGGLWLKLANDGDRAVVVFLGEPFPREVCFIDGKYVPFDDAVKAAGHKSSLRIAFNVAHLDTKEVKVFEQGSNFFKDLVRIRDKYGLDKWAFEIQRQGAAKDPKTTYSILPEHQLTPEQRKAFLALPQLDLGSLYGDGARGDREAPGQAVALGEKGSASSGPSPARPSPGVGGPNAKGNAVAAVGAAIDPQVASQIGETLRALPRGVVQRFLDRFAIQRVRDLPAQHAQQARAFVEQLVADATAGDVDPFGP